MKKYISCIIALVLVLNLKAQNQQNISLFPGYTHQSFYSMENHEIINVDNENWDLAFSTDIYSANIRINDGKGVELYTYNLGDISSWNSINNSTPNILTTRMYNSDTSWNYGAFVMNQSSDIFDYGWGVYNIQTHHIIGDSVFLIKTVNGNWKKLLIESKASGEYFFKYANLDGSNEISESIQASNYSDKRFIYYSLDNDAVLDREPSLSDWDITFTKYITPVQGMPYSVTGVLSNIGIQIAQADNISNPLLYTDYVSHNFENEMNSSGYDWKQFSGSYVIVPNRSYFIKNYQDQVWRLVFTGFDGMSTGNIKFESELISTTSTNNSLAIGTLDIFPNPSVNNKDITIIYDLQKADAISVHDLYGRKMYFSKINKEGFNTYTIDKNKLSKGTYIVNVSNQNGYGVTKKLIVY